jgi:hypothetical protein
MDWCSDIILFGVFNHEAIPRQELLETVARIRAFTTEIINIKLSGSNILTLMYRRAIDK